MPRSLPSTDGALPSLGRAPVRSALVVRAAGMHTSFIDALFISQRQALFTALVFEGAFQ